MHLSTCDGCLDAYLEAGLRRSPEAAIPRDFAAGVLEHLALPTPAANKRQRALFPFFTLAACLLAAVYALPMVDWNSVAAALDGATRLFGSYSGALANLRIDTDTLLSLLLGMGMVEMAAASAWLWRLLRA